MIFFSWVSSRVITPARPTSEPVPAVVGTAMIGAMPSVLARVHQSPMSSKSHTGRDCAAMNATHFLEVVTEGFLHITTIYDKDEASGAYPAVHSRHFGIVGQPIVTQYQGFCEAKG